MRAAAASLAAVLACASCGRIDFNALRDGAATGDSGAAYDPNGGSTSGTRLKLQWYAYPDGTRQLAHVYDTERAEICTPTSWMDGVLRCTPQTFSVFYADAACSQPIEVYPFPGETPPPYFGDYPGCNGPAHLYPTGPAIAMASFYEISPLGCLGPYSPSYDTYMLEPEVPAASFAQLATPSASAGGRLSLMTYTSDDGFSLQDTLEDTQLGATCTGQLLDGALDCLPVTSGTSSEFSDASCSTPFALANRVCPSGAYGLYLDNACVSHLAPLGSAFVPATVYSLESLVCVMDGPPDTTDFNYLMYGPDLAAAPLTHEIEAAPGHRLQRKYYAGDGARLRDELALYDTQLGTDCTSTLAADGVMRCLPTGPGVGTVQSSLFSDPACTMPVALSQYSVLECQSPPQATYAEHSSATGTQVYSVGAPFTGTLYLGGTSCTVWSQSGEAFVLLGSELDPTTFAPATQVQDP